MEMHICDVCKILDGNEELKECEFCVECNAWICSSDKINSIRRAHAMLKRKFTIAPKPIRNRPCCSGANNA